VSKLFEIVTKSAAVTKVSPWKDRHYISLAGFNGRYAGDRNLKVWIKGDTLTVEGNKGTRSSELSESLSALTAAVETAGATRKGFSDSIAASYTIA